MKINLWKWELEIVFRPRWVCPECGHAFVSCFHPEIEKNLRKLHLEHVHGIKDGVKKNKTMTEILNEAITGKSKG